MTRPYPLTPAQIHTLKLAYKFRFLTTHLLADYKHLTSYTTSYEALETLVKSKYLIKRLSSKDKADRKNAVYYLSASGIRYLREVEQFDPDVLRIMSKNSYVGPQFLEFQLNQFRLLLILRSHYSDCFHMFTKHEAANLDENIAAKPDMFLRAIDEEREPAEYLLYWVLENQMFIIKRLLRKIIADYNTYPADEPFPAVLLICPSPSAEKRILDYLRGLELSDELEFLTTTMKALSGATDPAVWTSHQLEDELVEL
jgi:hypothetical protein